MKLLEAFVLDIKTTTKKKKKNNNNKLLQQPLPDDTGDITTEAINTYLASEERGGLLQAYVCWSAVI